MKNIPRNSLKKIHQWNIIQYTYYMFILHGLQLLYYMIVFVFIYQVSIKSFSIFNIVFKDLLNCM